MSERASPYPAEAMVDVHTGELISGKGLLPDGVKSFFGHFGVGSVLNGPHLAVSDQVVADLTQKDAVGPDISFGAVFRDGISNEGGADGSLPECISFFGFFHGMVG